MMTRKKKRTLTLVILVVIFLIIAISLILLYLNTDMFKSSQTLFFKYLGKNVENIKSIEKIFEKTEYENLLENNKYLEEVETKVNYTEDYGTTSENTNNIINNLKLTVDGQVDKTNQYNYQNFKLWKEDNQIANIEFAQNNNIYGIRFSDLFKQYILVENDNLKELLKKLEYSEQEIENLPDSIEINKEDIASGIKFSEEEINNLKEKYLNIISQNLAKENFEKKSNQTISINEKEFISNAYILKLTNEQLNNIYINILENLKNEEIIFTKINNIQNFANKINSNSSDTINLKENFVKELEDLIEEINRNNIGTEETKIIVYENQGETVRTIIQGLDYEIILDCLTIEEEQFNELALKEKEAETQKITLKKNNQETNLYIENKENGNKEIINFEQSEKIKDKKCTKNINVQYQDETNKIEAIIIKEINIVNEFENQIKFDDQNSIKLNDLEEEQLEATLNKVNEGIKQKSSTFNQDVNIEDLQQILINIGIINNIEILEGEGISEIEKDRFNSKFEILVGQNINSENMLEILEVIKENVVNLHVVSNEELKIEIDKYNKNEQITQTLGTFIQNHKDITYNVEVEYDEIGLVKYIVLKVFKEQ